MTTIVNTPPSNDNGDSGLGIILGVILTLVVITLFFVYVLPTLRSNTANPRIDTVNIDVKLPTPAPGSTSTPTP